MKKEFLLTLLILFALPYPAQAFGSYSNDHLNTSNTEQNITFDVTPYSEIVYITIPRRVNVTSASWNLTGHQIIRGTSIDTFTGLCNGISSDGGLEMMANDGDFLYVGCKEGIFTNIGFLAKLEFNGSYTGTKWNMTENESVTSSIMRSVYTNGTYIWIAGGTPTRIYQFDMDMNYIQNFTPARDYFDLTGNNTHFFGIRSPSVFVLNSTWDEVDSFPIPPPSPASALGVMTDNEFIWTAAQNKLYKFNMNGTDTDINFSIIQHSGDFTLSNNAMYYVDTTNSVIQVGVVRTRFPENITIDTALNGENDYVNDTLFSTTVTIDLNETAINNFLRDPALCAGDFTTATCDVPFNLSSICPSCAGIFGITNISILGELIFGVFNVSILDEMTGDEFDISGSDSVVLSFFCANETQNITITSQGQEVNVLCVVDEVRITVTEATDEIIRYLVPITNQGDLNFYVYNSTEETDVTQDWLFFDVTGLYENGIAVVTKVIFDIGERTMIEKIIDSESKTTLFLVVGEKYCFSVFDSNRGNERDLGCMDADADTEKRISISTIPFAPDQAIAYEDVFIAFRWNKTAEIIQALYNDTLDETNSVTFTVYNATNSSEVLFTSTSTSSVVTFTYNNVDINGTFLARIVANHQRYGIIDPMKMIDFGGKYRVAGLGGLGLGIWMSIAGGMISMIVMLAFGKRYAKIGSAVFVFMILMFMQWGWFDESPQIGWLMLTFIAFIVFGNVMTLKRRLQ